MDLWIIRSLPNAVWGCGVPVLLVWSQAWRRRRRWRRQALMLLLVLCANRLTTATSTSQPAIQPSGFSGLLPARGNTERRRFERAVSVQHMLIIPACSPVFCLTCAAASGHTGGPKQTRCHFIAPKEQLESTLSVCVVRKRLRSASVNIGALSVREQLQAQLGLHASLTSGRETKATFLFVFNGSLSHTYKYLSSFGVLLPYERPHRGWIYTSGCLEGLS